MVQDFSQGYLFLIFILVGIVIGILFDIFRILRKTFKTSDFITYIEDILFWLLSGFILIYSIFIFNNGELRAYIFLSIFIGIIVYMLTISKYFIKLNVTILTAIKNAFNFILKIILCPIKFIIKVLKKIFSPIFKLLNNTKNKFITKIDILLHKIIPHKKKEQKV